MTLSLTEALGFEAGDANSTRYVGNSPPNKIDPDGLQETEPGRPVTRPRLAVPVIVIKMTAQPDTIALSKTIIGKANEIFGQCDVSLSKGGAVFPARPGETGKSPRIVFDARNSTFSGGGADGMTVKDLLNNAPPPENGIRIILVDQIIAPDGRPAGGVTYRPDKDSGRVHGFGIVLAVDPPRNKETDDPGRALAHECANYLGLEDINRTGTDRENLMSYGGRADDGRLIRGATLSDAQIRQLRSSIGKTFPAD